jgi:hypothetical protein
LDGLRSSRGLGLNTRLDHGGSLRHDRSQGMLDRLCLSESFQNNAFQRGDGIERTLSMISVLTHTEVTVVGTT